MHIKQSTYTENILRTPPNQSEKDKLNRKMGRNLNTYFTKKRYLNDQNIWKSAQTSYPSE